MDVVHDDLLSRRPATCRCGRRAAWLRRLA